MSELYREQLIKSKPNIQQKAAFVGLVLASAVVAGLGLFIMPIFLVAALALGFAARMAEQRLKVEYEYIYVNGELDVDVIYGQIKRKKAGSISLEELELMAPEQSHRLDAYRKNPNLRKLDFSSKGPEIQGYKGAGKSEAEETAVLQEVHRCAAVRRKDGKVDWIILDLDEDIINDMKLRAPRKIFLD